MKTELLSMQDETLRSIGLTLAEQFMAEGEAIGAAKGKAEGKAEGEAKGMRIALLKSILDILEEKFGEVPYTLREALHAMEDLQALALLPRAATKATSLEAFQRNLP